MLLSPNFPSFPLAVFNSDTSVQLAPFHDSVRFCPPPLSGCPPKINPEVVVPTPLAPYLPVFISAISDHEAPFQLSTKFKAVSPLRPPALIAAVTVPKPALLLLFEAKSPELSDQAVPL